jgi:hypothetical protein
MPTARIQDARGTASKESQNGETAWWECFMITDCQIVLGYRNEADGTVSHVVCIANWEVLQNFDKETCNSRLPLVTSQHRHESCEDNIKMCGVADCQLWTVPAVWCTVLTCQYRTVARFVTFLVRSRRLRSIRCLCPVTLQYYICDYIAPEVFLCQHYWLLTRRHAGRAN